ncbi:mitochondrial enolase superfamily member 1 [Grus japonensis]|uniref:Mitochondrial enolase superfamily member 1 n=1 Tax=Grus japonensis TaxID=30415 RepID=A0ABC9WSU8_GRUJA
MNSSWRSVTSSVAHGSILSPILLNIVINDLDDGAEYTLSKFADDTKLRGVADMPEGRAAIQKDLNGLEKWADRNLMKFNKEKCKVLHLWRNDPLHQDVLGAALLESSLAKNPGSQGSRLNMSQLSVLAANVANGVLHCMWEYCVQFWAPQYKKEGHTGESPRKGHNGD